MLTIFRCGFAFEQDFLVYHLKIITTNTTIKGLFFPFKYDFAKNKHKVFKEFQAYLIFISVYFGNKSNKLLEINN